MTIDEIIELALREDLGNGDHTSLATIPEGAFSQARLLVKEAGVLCGMELAQHIFHRLDPHLEFIPLLSDGQKIKPGDVAFIVRGNPINILSGERLALNFMQRLSGIATQTRRLVDAVEGFHAKLLDTRKTTPLLRELEKYAVRVGGGHNHRFGLFDMILIKDNHVDFAGGISQAIRAVHRYLAVKNLDLKIEIEVRNFDELGQVLAEGGVHRIMLDNFSPGDLRLAIERIDGRYETEASGGITLANIREYAATGVDYISVGALTHQIHSLDLSLKAF
ncbi:MAG: carboxylating nicotinate-nucleotide diphosphorylase [Bacteroidales bacterium]